MRKMNTSFNLYDLYREEERGLKDYLSERINADFFDILHFHRYFKKEPLTLEYFRITPYRSATNGEFCLKLWKYLRDFYESLGYSFRKEKFDQISYNFSASKNGKKININVMDVTASVLVTTKASPPSPDPITET
ncbi:MAG: hypothetical protein DRP13_03395 [Candidatus Aenigmatarchaeota archaeon]|nr:MAG: hypothetical protein DRP13_03395 [Candidatus Aenigmarchaeota archaeon]